jgi:type IV pilus assembly protein PilY1
MLVKQKQAFEKPEVTSGGTNQLFYGIDGPWTAYTEYVVDGSGYLTVGDGKGDQKVCKMYMAACVWVDVATMHWI